MRPLLGRLGVYLPAVLALGLPTAFIPTAEDSFILPRASIVIVGACLGSGVALLAPGGPALGRLRWPLLAAFATAILAFLFSISWPLSLAGSYTRYESLPVRLGYLGLFAMAVWLLRDRRSRDRVVAALVFGTAIACLEALVQVSQHVPYRPDGNLGNANLLGALVALAFPLAIARGLRGDRFTVAWWLGAVVLGGGLLATTSRSGGLGALAGCLTLAVFAFRGRLAAIAAIISTAVIATALLVIVLSPLQFLNDDPARLRIHLWQDGVRMIASRPLAGWGEDATGLKLGSYLSGDWSPGVTFDRIHSGPLDFAATQGIMGAVALAIILVILLRGAWRARSAGETGALVAACIGYSVWVLFNFDWAPATGALWLVGGTAWSAVRAFDVGGPQPGSSPSLPTARPAGWRSGMAIVLALAAIATGVLPVLADVWYLEGRTDLSVRVDPLQARYHWALGQGLVAQNLKARGVDEMLRAADLGETDPGLYVELGDAEAQLGRFSDAHRDYQRALQIDPFYAPASQRLAATGT
ncbi:MAG: O-antigen ligase family protein [Candidatus Dormibacteraceae bacterium]